MTEKRKPRTMPADPHTRPEDTLDALEERVFGEPSSQDRDEDDTDEPAFEQNFDTRDPDSDDADPVEHSG